MAGGKSGRTILMKSIQFKIGSICLWRVVCGVAPQISLNKLPSLGCGDEMANEADGGTRDTCAPHIHPHNSAKINFDRLQFEVVRNSTARLRKR